MSEKEDDQQEFTVTWSLQVEAFNAEHAAGKASDFLSSRQPISFAVFKGKGRSKRKSETVIPNFEDHVVSTIKRFLPGCEVLVEDSEEDYVITVVSDHFRDIPKDEDRSTFVSAMLPGLSEDRQQKTYYKCYTFSEYDEWGPGFDDDDDDDDDSGIDTDDDAIEIQQMMEQDDEIKVEPPATYGHPFLTRANLT